MPVKLPPPGVRWIGGPGGVLKVLDQTELPARVRWRSCRHPRIVFDAIRRLQVRGAPLIGIAAAYGMVLAARGCRTLKQFARAGARLIAARPTAVNLAWAVRRMLALQTLDRRRLLSEALLIHAEDRSACQRIGKHAYFLLKEPVLTHCNAGSLATGGSGTALAGIYEALSRRKKMWVFATETRPLLQGARLTAWELSRAGVDVTLLVDGAAAGLIASGRVRSVVVGADRIAANGDVANKVGTYALALAAKEHGVPFFVAAPLSTFDVATPTGRGIHVEQRDAKEVLTSAGRRTAARGIGAWNPAFDVTPAKFVTAIITEAGVVRAPYGASIQRITGGRSAKAAGRP
ncbi:MAG: S-methyl-5-thioribose-1-phosphate isomerase [Planctomycetes bacterium]|nr:S-methyl-5-thioribose-1-phosphate isomerase [Planctomycetota bacterium]